MKRFKILGLFIVAAAAMLPAQAQSTIYVNNALTAGCGDALPGTMAQPKCTIQGGVDAAGDGDEVRVMPGTYTECVLAFPGHIVNIVADAFDPGDPTTANQTTIDGTGVLDCTFDETPSGDPAAVVSIGHLVTLTGFRITGGSDSGVFALGTASITSNIVEGNSTTKDGGGIYVYSGNCFYGDTTSVVQNNTVRNNTSDRFGGGMSIAGGLRTFVEAPNCMIDGDATITIQGNTIQDNSSVNEGGGLIATTYTNTNRISNIVVTQNMITGNTASTASSYGYGGGIYGKTYGYGTESIDINLNTLDDNESTFDGGGGLSTFMVPPIATTIDHAITIDGNTVTGNRAGVGGGGMELVVSTESLTLTEDVHLVATGNEVTDNQVTIDAPLSTLGGGGIEARLFAVQSTSPNTELRIEGNEVTQNSSKVFGGGITVFSVADGQIEDDLGNPVSTGPSSAQVDLIQNRITGNSATSTQANSAGGGVFLYLGAQGESTATFNSGLNSVVGNTLDNLIEVGGIDVETELSTDQNAVEGQGVLVVNSTIVSDNQGFQLGGPTPGAPGLVTFGGGTQLDVSGVDYSDFYDPAGNDVSSWMSTSIGSNNLFVDPRFVDLAQGIHLRPDSPLVDQGDPALPAWAPATDLDGDPRVSDGDDDTVAVVDIGADELTVCPDSDGDGFTPDNACGPPGILDCDDAEPAVYPGADEICDGLNNDCDDAAWPNLSGDEADDDTDTYSECGGDCDDTNVNIHPNATEVCNGLDDDCNSMIDDGPDGDMDSFTAVCDCDDTNNTVYPGAPELCDSINNNCSDPNYPAPSLLEVDNDADTFAECAGDCDDTNSNIHPGATEVCNDVDDDCDMLTDEDAAGENTDGDTVHNACDNCPQDDNEDQMDTDADGDGDVCDADLDGDGVANAVDQCPDVDNRCDTYLVPGSTEVSALEWGYLGQYMGARSIDPEWQWAIESDFNNDGIIDGDDVTALALAWQCGLGERFCE